MESDLERIIDSKTNLSRLGVQYIMYQIILGLYYMHSANIVHRNLKPANILINSDYTVKLSGFWMARIVNTSSNLESVSTNQEEEKHDRKTDSGDEEEAPEPPVLKRQLSKHVATRFYRAPEVILLSQMEQHATAMDYYQ